MLACSCSAFELLYIFDEQCAITWVVQHQREGSCALGFGAQIDVLWLRHTRPQSVALVDVPPEFLCGEEPC